MNKESDLTWLNTKLNIIVHAWKFLKDPQMVKRHHHEISQAFEVEKRICDIICPSLMQKKYTKIWRMSAIGKPEKIRRFKNRRKWAYNLNLRLNTGMLVWMTTYSRMFLKDPEMFKLHHMQNWGHLEMKTGGYLISFRPIIHLRKDCSKILA